jgi:hypothetical protein
MQRCGVVDADSATLTVNTKQLQVPLSTQISHFGSLLAELIIDFLPTGKLVANWELLEDILLHWLMHLSQATHGLGIISRCHATGTCHEMGEMRGSQASQASFDCGCGRASAEKTVQG